MPLKIKDMYMYLEKGGIKIYYFGGIFPHGGVPPVHENNKFFRRIKDDLPIPKVKDDEVLIETHYGGLNFADLMMCQGGFSCVIRRGLWPPGV